MVLWCEKMSLSQLSNLILDRTTIGTTHIITSYTSKLVGGGDEDNLEKWFCIKNLGMFEKCSYAHLSSSFWWPLTFFWWRAVQTFITFGSANPHQRNYCRVVINTLASIWVSLQTWVSYRTVFRCRRVSNFSPWDTHGSYIVSTYPINLTLCVWKVYRSIQNTYSLCFLVFFWLPSVENAITASWF